MIKIIVPTETGKILGFAVQPHLDSWERAEIIQALPERARVGFIDLVPTMDIFSLILAIEARGSGKLVCYYDHHSDQRQPPGERANIRALVGKLGQGAKIFDRRRAPSSVWLVEEGEWRHLRLDAVIFHADPDGFLGFLKGLGLTYPEMAKDADILDDRKSKGQLSQTGQLLADAWENLGPYFSQDPAGFQATKQRVFQTLADWIAGGRDPEAILPLVAEVRTEITAARGLAEGMADEIEAVADFVAFSDFLPYIKLDRRIDFPAWKRKLLGRFGPVLFASTGKGHLGEMVFVELPKAWDGLYDLRDFLPRGVRGRLPGRVQVPRNRWEEFLRNWGRRKRQSRH